MFRSLVYYCIVVIDLCPPMLKNPAQWLKSINGVSQSCSVDVITHRLRQRKRAVLSVAAFLQVPDSHTNRAVIGVLAAALQSLVTKQECAVEGSLFKVCVYIAVCFCIWF